MSLPTPPWQGGNAASAEGEPPEDDVSRADAERAEADATLLADLHDGDWLDKQDFPPLAYAVDGLIPEGFSLLIGPPKAGKSWLALALLLAVASPNGYALGTIPTGPARRVLYLALEDGDRRMQERCRLLLSDGSSIPPMFHYKTRIIPNTVVVTIGAFLRRHPDTQFVVIDTLGKVMPPAMQGESAYQRDYRVGGSIKRIADDHPGLAVVVLHHDRKAGSEDFVDSVSGTHGLAGAADTIVVLARARQSVEGVLMVTGRDVEENEYALRLDGAAWQLDGVDLGNAAKRAAVRRETGTMSDRSTDILAFVRDQPEGVTAAEVSAKFADVDQDQARVYLGRLVKAEKIVRVARGRYGPLATTPGSNPVSSVSSVSTNEAAPTGTKQRNVNNTVLVGSSAEAGISQWPPTETGPCAKCAEPCHKYGVGGHKLCADCRRASA
jgi:AAA domain